MTTEQEDFDLTIGRLDRVLSKLVGWGRSAKRRNELVAGGELQGRLSEDMELLDTPNQQTLKHHAEDMIAAGQKILRDLGKEVEGTPQP